MQSSDETINGEIKLLYERQNAFESKINSYESELIRSLELLNQKNSEVKSTMSELKAELKQVPTHEQLDALFSKILYERQGIKLKNLKVT